jgi:proline-specific peptidase
MAEGFVRFRGFRTWYRSVAGDCRARPVKLPLLVLHGGPGASHRYLTTLEALASGGRRVILYDQLGCGASDHPEDESLWSVDLFLEELRSVRAALGLEQLHLLGHSWGGMLAMEYAITRPTGLASLIVASAPASMPQWALECRRLIGKLPSTVQREMEEHERAGTTGDAAYIGACMEFYRRHVCRLDPWPAQVSQSFGELLSGLSVYRTMNGPSEFCVTGRLRDWSVVDRLQEIDTPTLITSGRHDEATPAIMETVHRGITGSRWVIFPFSAHLPHIEESARYRKVVNGFLDEVEARVQ